MSAPNFANGTIWTGDNIHIMRGMNSGCVDLIYLDPPFNSNRHYEAPIGSKAAGAAFKDAWTLDDVDVCEHGELADRNPAAYCVIEAARMTHGKSMQSYLIFMAVRLLEMRRILKPTGSIYLHCDPTASHYLKLLMDSIFGQDSFRNEIVWQRTPAKALMTTRLATNHDILFVYQMAERATWNADAAFIPYDPNNLDSRTASKYRHLDADGRVYRLDNLTNPNRNRPNLTYEFMGVTRVWRWTQKRMLEAYDAGLVVQNKSRGVPQLKRYLDEQKGRPLGDIWADIPPINSQAKERIGYPTQKPLALLRRIITLSTCPDDFVLDPFCGCATALVAADRLQREWAGIDLSPLAIKLVNERIAGDRGLWAALRRWTHRQSERTSETCLTTGRTGIGSTASKKAFAWAARRTFHSASWTWITCCPGRRAAPTIPTTYNCSARAATGARAAGRWPNGGPRNDRQVTEAEAP